MTDEQFLSLPKVTVEGPAASVLADMFSIKTDLEFAIMAALKYAVLVDLPEGSVDTVTLQSMWNAAAISYRRAFGTGRALIDTRRSRLKWMTGETVANHPELSPEQRDAHTQTMEMANQHIAHRVAQHEDARIFAFLAPPPEPRAVVTIGWMAMRMAGPTSKFSRVLANVAQVLVNTLTIEIQKRQDELRAHIIEQDDLDDLYDKAAIIAAAEADTGVGPIASAGAEPGSPW